MESYSVEAILSAVDKGFTDAMKSADKSMGGLDKNTQKTNMSVMDMAKGVGVFKLVDSAIGMVKNSMDGAINRFDTLNKYPVVMEALGYSTGEVDKSMQKLTDGIDGLPTRLDDIVANTQQLAISTGSLDKGTDTAIALNNAFLASGASSDAASRGMEQYRQMLGRGEVDMQSFKSVQETMPIAMDKVAKSFEDRGVTSTNALYDALKKGDITFTEFNDKLIELNDGVGGFADLAQKNSKGIKTSWANIQSAVVKGVEKTIRAIDEGLQGANLGSIADILDKVKEKINEAFGVIQKVVPPAIKTLFDLYETMKPYLPLMATMLGYFTVFSTVVSIQSKIQALVGAYKAWTLATEGATIAQKILNTVMKANWIAIIISAVIALVGYVIYLWKTNENFRNAVIKIWEDIKKKFDEVSKAVVKYWEATKKWFSEFWEWLKQVPQKTLDYIKQKWETITTFFSDLWTKVKTKTSEIWESIKEMFGPYVEMMIAPFRPMIEFFSGLWENIRSIASSSWELIKTAIMGPVLLLIDLITLDFTQFKDDLIMLWTNILENASNIFTNLKDVIVNLVIAIVDTLKARWENLKVLTINAWNATVDAAKIIWKALKEWFVSTVKSIVDGVIRDWENLKRTTSNVFNALVDAVKQIWEDFKQSVRDLVDSVTGTFDKLSEIDLWEAGKAIIDGFIKGLKSTWEEGKKFISGIGDWIRENKGPISYDKRLLIDNGQAIMGGLNKGLISGFNVVKSTIDNATDYFARTPFSTDIDIMSNVSDLNSRLSNANMSLSSNNELTLNESKRPMQLNLNIGGQNFRGFVDNISDALTSDVVLEIQN